ncbi:MAG: GTPase HflX, partial [Bdellovibrionales bacterium]|nr:GTPase HflX [Bdellovibrionales bacterium]
MHSTEQKVPDAILVGVQTPGISDAELQSSLDELSRLVTTLGYNVVGRLSQKRPSDRSAAVLGDGKLKELASWTGGTGAIGPMVVKKKHKAALRAEQESAKDDEEIEYENDEYELEPHDDGSSG